MDRKSSRQQLRSMDINIVIVNLNQQIINIETIQNVTNDTISVTRAGKYKIYVYCINIL